MTEINEEQIERGKALRRLLENPDFQIFYSELAERMEIHSNYALNFRLSPAAPPYLFDEQRARYQALYDLQEWINEEIEAGGREIIKKSGGVNGPSANLSV